MKNMKLLSGHKRIVNTFTPLLLILFFNLLCVFPNSKSEGSGKLSGMGNGDHKAVPNYIETDSFDYSYARIRLVLPDTSTEYISLIGSSIMKVYFEGVTAGTANDTSGNGLDEVPTELTKLNLIGTGPSVGPVIIQLNSQKQSVGIIEEMTNNTPGILDVPPFTATGMAFSFFDVYVEIEINGQILHTNQTQRLLKNLTHKPPLPGDTYTNPSSTPLELFNESEDKSGMSMIIDSYIPAAIFEIDTFDLSLVQIRLILSKSRTVVISLPGTSQWNVFFEGSTYDGSALDDDNDGLDDVISEISNLNLARLDSTLGNVSMHLYSRNRTLGIMEELANFTPGRLDVPPFTATGAVRSSFAAFVEIVIDKKIYHTSLPYHLQSDLYHKPPAPGTKYIDPFSSSLELLDESDLPTGNYMKIDYYIPNFILSPGNTWMLQ